jgi:hypothetical protein
MHKNYYLLRNNHESGPYTIDELLLQQLKPTDLVWVEGKMNAWCHPSELEELTTTYSINKTVKQKVPSRPRPIKQSPPAPTIKTKEDIETRAEEIRKNILMQSEQIQKTREIQVENDQTPTTYKLDEDAIEVVFHKKKRLLPGAHFSAAAVMMLIISAVWFGKDIWVKNAQSPDSIARRMVSGENLEQVNQLPREAKAMSFTPLSFPQQEALPVVDVAETNMPDEIVPSATGNVFTVTTEPKIERSVARTEIETPVKVEPVQKKEEPVVSNEVKEVKEVTEAKEKEPVKKDSQAKKEVVKDVRPKETKKDSAVVKSDSNSEAVEETDKKKSLGQVIKGIFKKKKRSGEEEEQE